MSSKYKPWRGEKPKKKKQFKKKVKFDDDNFTVKDIFKLRSDMVYDRTGGWTNYITKDK